MVQFQFIAGANFLFLGRKLKGIHFAMEFLHGNTKTLLDSGLEQSILDSIILAYNALNSRISQRSI